MRIKYIVSNDLRVQDFNNFIETKFPHFLVEKHPEIVLVAGGDGALHHAIYQNSDFKGIFLGKAMGTLNFLMNTFENDFEQLKALENDKQQILVIPTETISVAKNGVFCGIAANDVLLGDSVNSYHTYNINTEDRSFNDFALKGTGLCISTPLGSTGYNLNNGGPILPLESKLWSITGIACNRLVKDIIPSQKVTIKASSSRLFISGIDKGDLTINDQLDLTVGKEVKLGFLDKTSFMQRRVDFSHRFRKET